MNAYVEPKSELEQNPKFELPIKNYSEFYRFYLTEHRSMMSRRLHAAGSSLGIYFFSKAIRQRKAKYVAYGLLSGYACAWVGHFVFEKNKPASFKQPLYIFISDWRMLSDIVRGNLSLKDRSLDKIES
ncbi:Mpo1-like protein [Acinetobacter guillouiae]|uniref:Mpo1-like protein n=1 Tax=Acinetobacter guillouiae TaxID=106649 RepID=UPI003AF4ED65